uniref:Uncharacterized protein n=1 Tax=Piliocolobus tephrosceles TaxID=591936 RepID=A0A8C9LKQ3_9PRIM
MLTKSPVTYNAGFLPLSLLFAILPWKFELHKAIHGIELLHEKNTRVCHLLWFEVWLVTQTFTCSSTT